MTPTPNPPVAGEIHRYDVGLEDLQTFLAVAELGSFSQAASQLNLSQPSISNRIRRLEEKLLTQLLLRTTRRVELTPQGRRLYLQASETLRSLRTLFQEFGSEASLRDRQVRIAATLTVATIGLPPILRRFRDAHPAISLALRDCTPSEAMDYVTDGTCDLAVLAMKEPRSGLSFEPLVADPCVVVAALRNPLLRHAAVPFAEVLEHALLSPSGHVGLRRAVVAEAEKRGLSVRFSAEAEGVSNAMTLIAMAAADFGVCIHPRSFVPAELQPTVGVVPFSDCEIVRTFGILTCDSRPLSLAARNFCGFLTASLPQGATATGRGAGPTAPGRSENPAIRR